MQEIHFAHPHTLFEEVEKVLKKVGPEKFFSSPIEEVKKAREGFAAYFFTLALKKYTGRDWWLAQYDQAVRSSPDFDFISFTENPDDLKLEPVEMTGVYPHFKSFDEVLRVIEKKQKKYGTSPVKFSLLVFVNHAKSEEWINQLIGKVGNESPFLSVWTIHLLFKTAGEKVAKAVAQRIAPLPNLRIEADMDDTEIHKPQPLPSCVEQMKEGERVCLTFKTEFINEINSLQSKLK